MRTTRTILVMMALVAIVAITIAPTALADNHPPKDDKAAKANTAEKAAKSDKATKGDKAAKADTAEKAAKAGKADPNDENKAVHQSKQDKKADPNDANKEVHQSNQDKKKSEKSDPNDENKSVHQGKIGTIKGEKPDDGAKIVSHPPKQGDRTSGEMQSFVEKKQKLLEKFGNFSDEKKQELKGKLAAMKEKRSITDEKNHAMSVKFADMTDDEKKSEIEDIRENRRVEREARANMTDEEKQTHMEQIIQKAKESRANNVSINEQIGLGADVQDIVCAEEKELVVKVSNGLPKCVTPAASLILMDRGIVTVPESA